MSGGALSWRTRRRLRNLVSVKAWRYRFAYQLDRLPSMCWSHLVDRIEFEDAEIRLVDCLRSNYLPCSLDVERLGSCYCGKVEMRDGVEVVVR